MVSCEKTPTSLLFSNWHRVAIEGSLFIQRNSEKLQLHTKAEEVHRFSAAAMWQLCGTQAPSDLHLNSGGWGHSAMCERSGDVLTVGGIDVISLPASDEAAKPE